MQQFTQGGTQLSVSQSLFRPVGTTNYIARSFGSRRPHACASWPGDKDPQHQSGGVRFRDMVRGLLSTLLSNKSPLDVDNPQEMLGSWGPHIRIPVGTSTAAGEGAQQPRDGLGVVGTCEGTLFQVAEMPGRGGLGVFALQEITAGTRILVDPLLFSVPVAFDDDSEQQMQSEVRETVAALPSTQQQAYLLLANSQPEDINNSSSPDSSANSSAAVGVFRTNSYAIQRNGSDEAGIFVSTSRFNHSCNCNVEHSFNNTLQAMTLHTSRDISCGEELCTSYLEMAQSRQDRQDELLKYFNFVCCCEACVLSGSDLTASDSRRLEIVSSEVAFQSALSSQQYREGVRLVQRRISLIQEEGLSGLVLLGECYYDAYEACRRAGRLVESRQWLQLAYDSAVTAQGEDGAGALMFGRLLTQQDLVAGSLSI